MNALMCTCGHSSDDHRPHRGACLDDDCGCLHFERKNAEPKVGRFDETLRLLREIGPITARDFVRHVGAEDDLLEANRWMAALSNLKRKGIAVNIDRKWFVIDDAEAAE